MNWPKKSIEGKIRKSLLGYTIFIVVLLWTFQIAFINTYYQTMQRMSILRAGKEIIRSVGQENFEVALKASALSTGCAVWWSMKREKAFIRSI